MSDDNPVVRALAARCQHLMVPDQCIICLRRRVAELEPAAARRLELLRPFAEQAEWVKSVGHCLYPPALKDVRAAAAEVAAKGADRG